MRTETSFGLSGLVALLSLCCLPANPGLSQTTPPPANAVPTLPLPAAPRAVRAEDPPPAQPTAADLRQLQDAYQSAHDTIETLREQMQAEIERHATSITAQLTLLKQDVTAQREVDWQAMRGSNQTTLTIVLVMIGILALGVMFIALVPLRMMNRLAARVAATPAGPTLAVEDAYHAAFMPLEQSSTRLQSAVQLLEQRLIELETRSTHPHTSPAAPSDGPAKPAEARPPPKAPSSPRVSLAMGGGEALMFLPQDARVPKVRSHLTLLQKLKQVFKPAASSKPGPAKAG